MNEPLRPETLALDALIEQTVAQAQDPSAGGDAESMLFLGTRHHAFPTTVIKDPVLEPVDKLVWMVIMLGVQETGGNTAFPGYDAIGNMANVASRSTIARSIAILRVTRWLTHCRRVRMRSGRFRGNVYALHDEPLPLADACHLDADYLTFLQKATGHSHSRVRAVARGVLRSMDEDIALGRNILAPEHPIERRLQLIVAPSPGHRRRFFAFTGNVVRQLRRALVTDQQPDDRHDQNSNLVKNDRVRNSNSGGSSSCSYINKKTTTTTTALPKFEPGGGGGSALVYPERLGDNQRGIADRYLATVPPVQRQPILDELEGRFLAEKKGMKPIYDEIRFLNSLCRLAKQGKFEPNLGLKVRQRREGHEAGSQRTPAAAGVSAPAQSDHQREQRLAVSRASLISIRECLGTYKRLLPAADCDTSKMPTE